MNGSAGADLMIGGLGSDIYIVNNKQDVVVETSTLLTEFDLIESTVSYTLSNNVEDLILIGSSTANGTGNTLDNFIVGNQYNNKLSGKAGSDTLSGGLGKDVLTGGSGADQFEFNAEAETGITESARDTIVDFNHRQRDKIYLSAIDADTTRAGDNAFSAPRVGGAFSGIFTRPGALYFDKTAHILYGNNDADAEADFSIQLSGGVTKLTAADFVL